MIHNPVIDQMLQRKSIRRYTAEQPSDEVIETIVRAGQQAPFAYQLGSLLLRRDAETNPFHAPLYFTVSVDVQRFERIMAARGWQSALTQIGLPDAIYGRSFPAIPVRMPGIPHNWYVTARKGNRS